MDKVRPRFCPEIPWYSTFPELNVRTYVKHKGKSGVYFLSLDAGRKFFAWGGRKFFHLPYYFSKMKIQRQNDSILFSSHRLIESKSISFEAEYKPFGDVFTSSKGSLEEFLTDKYSLLVVKAGRVGRCDIDHPKWLLQNCEIKINKNNLLSSFNIEPQKEPLVYFSKVLDVRIWPLRFL